MRLRRAVYGELHERAGQHYAWLFWCPGCKEPHQFDARWTFNGNEELPTFAPSLLVNGNEATRNPAAHRCHLFLKDGMLEFLGDCSHELAGKTVVLPDWE